MSANDSGLGALCFKSPGVRKGSLCFCARQGEDFGKLVYKGGGIANVYIAWEAPNRDLDICAYWDGNPDGKVGYGWERVVGNETYNLRWYGDDTGTGGTEHLLPQIKPDWSATTKRTLLVHLNYFPAGGGVTGVCSVRVTSADGSEDMTLDDVTCGKRGGKALETDPGVAIVFDASGKAVSITPFG